MFQIYSLILFILFVFPIVEELNEYFAFYIMKIYD